LPVKPAIQINAIGNLVHEIIGFQAKDWRIGV
jgi:hypothetical protein